MPPLSDEDLPYDPDPSVDEDVDYALDQLDDELDELYPLAA